MFKAEWKADVLEVTAVGRTSMTFEQWCADYEKSAMYPATLKQVWDAAQAAVQADDRVRGLVEALRAWIADEERCSDPYAYRDKLVRQSQASLSPFLAVQQTLNISRSDALGPLLTALHEQAEPVAWMRLATLFPDDEPRYMACASDAPDAFKVWR